MRSSKAVAPIFTAVLLLSAAAAEAAHVDMKDSRRALGREDDVRVDAELVQDTVSSNQPIYVTYQIENLSAGWIAIADKVANADFDAEARTITLSIGAEVPKDGTLPHMVMIAPGEKMTFTAGANAHVAAPTSRSPFAAIPKYVQITVNFLRDVNPFKELITKQSVTAPPASIRLSDAQFDAWLQANDSVVLNSLPVDWQANSRSLGGVSAEDRTPSAGAPSGGSWE